MKTIKHSIYFWCCFFLLHFPSLIFATSLDFAPPANDNCANAIEITNLSSCNLIHVSGIDATSENNTSGCRPELADTWYKFTATSDRILLKTLDVSTYNSFIEFEVYETSCTSTNRILNTCFGLGGDGHVGVIWDFNIGTEYFLRIWFIQGQEADICLSEACDMNITNQMVGTCDNGDNTYDLTVDVSATNLTIGDSLVLFAAGGGVSKTADNGLKITNSSMNFTFNVASLVSSGTPMGVTVSEWNNGCSEYFSNIYTAPTSCVSPPANDNCANAIEILDLLACNTLHASTIGATSEYNTNGCNISAGDIWYKFTATSTRIALEGIEFSDYGNSEIVYELYTDGCAGNTRLNNTCYSEGNEGNKSIIENLIVGNEYYLEVWFSKGQEADFCLTALCDIGIQSHSTTTCDNGDNTYDLTVEVSATGLAVGDSLVLNISGYGLADTGFKITSAAETFTFIRTGLPSTGNTVSLFVHEWVGACSKNFDNYYTAPSPCVTPPANDECMNATSILNLSSPDTFHVRSIGSTPSNNLTNSCFSNTSKDVWYKFIATSTKIGVRGIEFSDNNILEYEIYQDSCNATSRLGSCVGTCENCYTEFENLTIGVEYYMRFSFYQDVEADISIENLCDFEIISHSITACDPADNTYELTIEVATDNVEVGDELSFLVDGSPAVLMTVTNIASSYTFVIPNLTATGAGISFRIYNISKTDCSEFFYHYYTAPASCVPSPANDNCVDAIEIKDIANCNLVHPNLLGATTESNAFGCDQNAIDVWYKFTANVPEVEIKDIDIASYGSPNLAIDVYEGPCDNLTRKINECKGLCDFDPADCEFSVDNLIIGKEYYIRIWANNSGEADFCIQALNGDICNDVPLNLNGEPLNPATFQTNMTITSDGTIPSGDSTSFIAAQNITLTPGFEVQAGAKFYAYIESCTPVAAFIETAEETKERGVTKDLKINKDIANIPFSIAPNPFSRATTIQYALGEETRVSLKVYAMNGGLVKDIIPNRVQQKGVYEYNFEPETNKGNIYFAVLVTGEEVLMKKLVFIR